MFRVMANKARHNKQEGGARVYTITLTYHNGAVYSTEEPADTVATYMRAVMVLMTQGVYAGVAIAHKADN